MSLDNDLYRRLVHARAHVDKHPSADLTCKALARRASLTTAQFEVAFQDAFGVAPAAYVAQRRQTYATFLRVTTALSDDEIARAAGLS